MKYEMDETYSEAF